MFALAKLFIYIPHGSDETKASLLYPLAMFVIYIPHGSDETSMNIKLYHVLFTFISHMVQMKLFSKAPDSCLNVFIYIPHGSDETTLSCGS